MYKSGGEESHAHCNAQVALVATAGLIPFLAGLGADADRVFGPAGLDAGRLSEASTGSIPLAVYVDIMEQAARQSRCDNFGLRFGGAFPVSCHGLIGDVVLSAPSIGVGFRQYAELFSLHQEASQVAFCQEGNLMRLEYRILDWRIYDRRQDAELTIAMFLNLLAHAYGPDFKPEEVHFEHPAPGETAEHESIFDAPVFFGQLTNAILFRPCDLGRPMPETDAKVFSGLMAEVSQRRRAGHDIPLVERVRAEIRSRLCDGYPPMDHVADAIGIARWTMQRRLAALGLTYSDAVQDVRRSLARSYLAFPHLSISNVSQLLGYAELSPFNRACKRWFGASPEQIRLTQRS